MDNTYDKKTLSLSKRYRKYQDIVMGLLDDDKEYSLEEVDTIINKFLGKENE